MPAPTQAEIRQILKNGAEQAGGKFVSVKVEDLLRALAPDEAEPSQPQPVKPKPDKSS